MTTALAQLEPSNMAELMQFSTWLAKSQLIPKALQGKPADVAIVLMKGRDLGLTSMQALATINVIEGKPVMASELIVALCVRNSEVCEFFRLVESTAEKATFEAKRRGSPSATRITWTIQQAQRAGLLGKDNWKRHTEAMLRWRASAALARAEFPDLTLGIVTPEEAEEIASTGEARDVTPQSPPAATRTEEVKNLLKAKAISVVDVQPGETEEQAVARESTAPADPAPRSEPPTSFAAPMEFGP